MFKIVCPDTFRLDAEAQPLSGPTTGINVDQDLPCLDEYKEDQSSAASRTYKYGERATEESDAVIAKSGDSAVGYAGWQVDVPREV